MHDIDEGLSREIRKWDLVALLLNVTVGAGIFRVPAEVQGIVGNYSLAAFIACAVIVGLIALCFAEVASRFRGTGGPYLYARETFGPTFAFIVGWLMWLTRLGGFATLMLVLVSYLGYFWPPAESGLTRFAIITGLVLCLTLINIIGVRQSTRLSNLLTISKLIPLVIFVLVGVFLISPARFALPARPSVGTFTAAVFILVYLFSGFEAVLVNSGEIREPTRVIPFALIVALSASVLLFLLIQIVCIGTLPELATSQRPLADASRVFLGTLGPAILSAGALVSILGTLNVIMLACTRLPFAMSMQGQLPAILKRVHQRFHTPHVSIVLSAAVVLLLSLSGTFIYALKFTVITRIVVYASTCLALPILRWRDRAEGEKGSRGEREKGRSLTEQKHKTSSASFRAPAGNLISIVCIVFCLLLLATSGWREARDVVIAVGIGLGIYAFTWHDRSSKQSAR